MTGGLFAKLLDSAGSCSRSLESCWRVMMELSARNSSSCLSSRVRLSLTATDLVLLGTYRLDGPERPVRHSGGELFVTHVFGLIFTDVEEDSI